MNKKSEMSILMAMGLIMIAVSIIMSGFFREVPAIVGVALVVAGIALICIGAYKNQKK